jgi:hypothetical protein
MDDIIYLVSIDNPITMNLAWNFNDANNYGLRIASSNFNYDSVFSNTNQEGGETLNIDTLTEDSTLLIYASYNAWNGDYNMSNTPATLTANWGDQNYTITYDGGQVS